MRNFIFAAAMLAATLSLANPAHAEDGDLIANISLPDGFTARGVAVTDDKKVRIVGYTESLDDATDALDWETGDTQAWVYEYDPDSDTLTEHELPTVAGRTDVTIALAINEVGTGVAGSAGGVPVIWNIANIQNPQVVEFGYEPISLAAAGYASGVSNDLLSAAGAKPGGGLGFVWTSGNGAQDLPDLVGNTNQSTMTVLPPISADGKLILGSSQGDPDAPGVPFPVSWTLDQSGNPTVSLLANESSLQEFPAGLSPNGNFGGGAFDTLWAIDRETGESTELFIIGEDGTQWGGNTFAVTNGGIGFGGTPLYLNLPFAVEDGAYVGFPADDGGFFGTGYKGYTLSAFLRDNYGLPYDTLEVVFGATERKGLLAFAPIDFERTAGNDIGIQEVHSSLVVIEWGADPGEDPELVLADVTAQMSIVGTPTLQAVRNSDGSLTWTNNLALAVTNTGASVFGPVTVTVSSLVTGTAAKNGPQTVTLLAEGEFANGQTLTGTAILTATVSPRQPGESSLRYVLRQLVGGLQVLDNQSLRKVEGMIPLAQ